MPLNRKPSCLCPVTFFAMPLDLEPSCFCPVAFFSQLEILLLVYVILLNRGHPLPGGEVRYGSSHLVTMKPQPSSLSWHSKLSWCCRHRHSTFKHVSSLKLLILQCVGYPARIFFWIKWVAKQARSSGNTFNHFCDQHMNFKNCQYKLQLIIWHSGT